MYRLYAHHSALFRRTHFVRALGLCLAMLVLVLFETEKAAVNAEVNTEQVEPPAATVSFPPSSFTCDYYASPTALASGTGTLSNPWTLQNALNQTTVIGAGKTLCLQGGTYRGKFRSILNGVTVRAAPGASPMIDGYVYTTLVGQIDAVQTTFTVANASVFVPSISDGGANGLIIDGEALFVSSIIGNVITAGRAAGGSSTGAVPHANGAIVRLAGNQLLVDGANGTYQGFEITNTDPLRNWQTDGGEGLRGAGIFNTGNGNKFINLIVHDNLSGIFSGSSSSNTEIYGCLSYNNGMYDPGAVEPPAKGHGMYLENEAGYLRVYESIALNNFNNGAQFYGRSAESVGSDIQGSVFANSGSPLAAASSQRNRNLLIGTETQRIPNILVQNNYLFQPHTVNGSNLTIGYEAGIDDGQVLNNYFVGGGGAGLSIENATHITVSGNKFHTTNATGVNIQSSESPYAVDNNTYYGTTSSALEFGNLTTHLNQTFASWKATTGFDLASTATSSPLPDTVIVRPNVYEPGRANIIVFISSGGLSTSVNLGLTGLANGQPYKIISAFNFGGVEVKSGVFNSSSPTISLPLSGLSAMVATPVGATYTPPSTQPHFGVFIVIPSPIPVSPTPTNTPTNTPTPTATPTATATPVSFVTGTVTYGNSIGSPSQRFVSNVLISGVGLPYTFAYSAFPSGTYSLGVGLGAYVVTPSKTGGQNGAINSFDAAKISASVSGTLMLTPAQQIAADVSGNGFVNSFDAAQVARYTTSLGQSGLTGTWKFTPVNRAYLTVGANFSDEDYTAFLLGEVSGNWNNTGDRPDNANAPKESVSIAAPQITAAPNAGIVVPVSVRGITDKGIISYEFDLRYDPLVIQPVADAVDVNGTVSRGLHTVINTEEAGRLRVALYGPIPINADGILMRLKFIAVGTPGSSSTLVWERFVLNDGELGLTAANGEIDILARQ